MLAPLLAMPPLIYSLMPFGCSKPGYKQVRVNRRNDNADGKSAIEIECILRRT